MLDKLERAFHEAVVLGDAERQAYLGTLRANDPSLAGELERMLDADGRSDAVIESRVTDALMRFREDSSDR